MLTNLSIHIQSLFELILTQREQAFWLCNQNSDPKILGRIDNKMLEILMLLIKTKIGTARSVAENIEHNTSKKAIGNMSVYLQSLFKQGLLMREKITALDHPHIQRGWTYEYYPCPIFWQLRK